MPDRSAPNGDSNGGHAEEGRSARPHRARPPATEGISNPDGRTAGHRAPANSPAAGSAAASVHPAAVKPSGAGSGAGRESSAAAVPAPLPLPRTGLKGMGSITADRLDLAGSSIGDAVAQSISVRQGAVGRISRAVSVDITQSAVGGIRADRVSIERGALGGAIAREVSIHQAYAQGVVALNASLRQAIARTIVANHVEMAPGSGALIVIARRVDGGRSLLDWRGALVLGAVFAAVSVAFARRRQAGGTARRR